MAPLAQTDRETRILELWEAAVGLPRRHRVDALLRHLDAPRSLGERNRALIAVRGMLFGRSWELRSDCPACATECGFLVDSVELAESLESPPLRDAEAEFDREGRPIALRAPVADDLSAIGDHADVAGAARALLARCVQADVDLSLLGDNGIERLEARIESLDPAATISFALTCPACDHKWPAPFDVAEGLWMELQRAAERSLTEVDALARSYGWTEEQVMELSPVRRAAYLQLASAS